MNALPSEIKLIDFNVLQSHYKYIPAKKQLKTKDVTLLHNSYELDIDFSHQENKDGLLRVFAKIEINGSDKPSSGYQLYIEGVADFVFTETSNLTELQKNNLKTFSTVNILIGYLRGSLASLTAASPLGQYLLPPININDLFAKKAVLDS